jgi:hypothetical protein
MAEVGAAVDVINRGCNEKRRHFFRIKKDELRRKKLVAETGKVHWLCYIVP